MSKKFNVQMLQACPTVRERFELLETHLVETARHFLHLAENQSVPRDQTLFDFGLHSLTATEFQYRLEKSLSVKFDSSVIFNHPTINALRDYLANEKLTTLFAEKDVVEFSTATVRKQIGNSDENHSDEDLDANYVKAMLKRCFGI